MSEIKQRRVRWKKLLITLGLILGGLYLINPLVMNVMVWHFARELGQEHPAVSILPQQLETGVVAGTQSGTTIERFGYSFQFPLSKVTSQQDFKSIAAVHFESGLAVLIMDPAAEMDMLSLRGDERETSTMKQMFTSHELESHYNYAVAMMNAKPDDVSLLNSRMRNARAMMLLSMKSMEVSQKPTAIFQIESPRMKGFQLGDPRAVPTAVTLKLYDAQDHQIEIHLAGQKQSNVPVITQAQINAIIASIHRAN